MNDLKRDVILLTSHIANEFVLTQYHKLLEETKGFQISVVLLLQEEYIKEENRRLLEGVNYHLFSLDSLNKLGYEAIEETIIPGSNHFPVLQFYKEYPDYRYYWNIEFDVSFSGNWSTFFSVFEDTPIDFLTSHVQRLQENQIWTWWHSLHLHSLLIQPSKFLKSFNPVYRISNSALTELDIFLSSGIFGHHEVLMPTLLHYLGFSIGDFGGNGSFVPSDLKELFYTANHPLDLWYEESTMRYRPLYYLEDMKIPDKLYHPIKTKHPRPIKK